MFLTVLEAGQSKIKVPEDWTSGEGRFLVHRRLAPHSVLTLWKRREGSLVRALIPLARALPS